MKIKCASSITVALLALAAISPALAVPSAMSHEMSGTVQRIDPKTITIRPDGSTKPVAFAWNSKDTQFFRAGRPTTSESLPVGAKVQIKCSHPIVGSSPLLYRVSWRTTAAGNKIKSHYDKPPVSSAASSSA